MAIVTFMSLQDPVSGIIVQYNETWCYLVLGVHFKQAALGPQPTADAWPQIHRGTS